MGFSELDISQQLKDELSSALNSGRFPHAAILEDEDSERLLSTAQTIAAALVCTGDNKPCGKCLACMKAVSDCHPDIRTYSGEETPNSFKVDMVRELRNDAYIVPNEAEHKVYILKNAHNMSVQAQNALLKVLEEPPQAVCFLLLTPDRNLFLQTVLSRCSVFSQGGGRQTDSEVRQTAQCIALAIAAPNEYELMSKTAVFEKNKGMLRAVLPELTEIFRAAVLIKSGAETDGEYADCAVKLSQLVTVSALLKLMTCVEETAQCIDRNENNNLLITRFCANLRRASGR